MTINKLLLLLLIIPNLCFSAQQQNNFVEFKKKAIEILNESQVKSIDAEKPFEEILANVSVKKQRLINALKNVNFVEEFEELFKDTSININERDSYGFTPLMWAVINADKIELVKILLKQGADVNTQDYMLGQTVLMWAAMYNHIEIMKLLLKPGTKVNAVDNYGKTALMIAASKNNLEAVKLLLEAGAEVNAQDHIGRTALMESLMNIDIVKLLLDYGADVNIRDNEGNTVSLWASHLEQQPVVDLLSKQMKQRSDFKQNDGNHKKQCITKEKSDKKLNSNFRIRTIYQDESLNTCSCFVNKKVVLGSKNGNLFFVNVADDSFNKLQITEDGDQIKIIKQLSKTELVVGLNSGKILIFDMNSMKIIRRIRNTVTTSRLLSLTVLSKDTIAACFSDKSWAIINCKTLETNIYDTTKFHSSYFQALKDRNFAIGTFSDALLICNPTSKEIIKHIDCQEATKEKINAISCIEELPDGSVAVGLDQGTLQIWDWKNDICLLNIDSTNKSALLKICYSPNDYLLTFNRDNKFKIYNLKNKSINEVNLPEKDILLDIHLIKENYFAVVGQKCIQLIVI